MNCPQCQTVNGPNAGFCGNCGARLAPAAAPSAAAPTAASPAAGGGAYPPPPGAPHGYNPAGAAPAGYNPAGGGSASPGYGGPGGYNSPPPSYGPPVGQAPGGYPPGQFQPGQYPQGQYPPPYQPSGSSSGLPPVNFDLTRLSTVDRVVGGATLITMISLWLPWYTATYLGRSSGSISGTSDHGWLWLEFILALALLAYLGARAAWDQLPFSLPVAHERLLIAGTALQFVLILIAFFAVPSTSGVEGFSVSWDFGAFLALIGSIAAVGPVAYPVIKTYLDNRKAAGPRTY